MQEYGSHGTIGGHDKELIPRAVFSTKRSTACCINEAQAMETESGVARDVSFRKTCSVYLSYTQHPELAWLVLKAQTFPKPHLPENVFATFIVSGECHSLW